ncbi:MAG: PIN domain-containing protein [Deltaproteobacteria bacterium]|nr:PIN domain-containing protein [Deltaproteobacteria bacterium]
MRKLYVIDTCCLIAFFDDVFNYAPDYEGSLELSSKTKTIISQAVLSETTDIRLSIPSVVFIEIYEKWLRTEEFSRRFFYEVYSVLKQSENIEIRPIDREVLEKLIKIDGILKNHDLHDKIVLASAITLESPLITTDTDVINYVSKRKVIPGILN